MKRRKVMRLLAVVLAASLAVTSQGIPSGLTTVYADGVTVTPQNSGLTAGHVYQKVTKTVDGEETGNHHTVTCYGTDAAVEVAGGKYVEEIDEQAYTAATTETPSLVNTAYWHVGSKYYKAVDSTTIVKADTSVTTNPKTEKVTVTLEGTHIVPKNYQNTSEGYEVVSVTSTATESVAHQIEEARINTNSTDYGNLVYYIGAEDDFSSSKYNDGSLNVDAGDTGGTVLFNTTSRTGGYYTILKYGKAASGATDLAGEVTISTETVNSSIFLDNAASTNGVDYIPALIKSYDLPSNKASVGQTQLFSDVTYEAVAVNGTTGEATWADTASSNMTKIENGYYTVSEDKVELTVVTPMKDNEASGDNCTIAYKYTDGEVKLNAAGTDVELAASAEITDGTIISVTTGDGDNAKTNYYIDVTDKFVTAIAMNSTKVTGTQYVTTSTKETELVDDVKLSFGIESKETPADVAAADVTSAYSEGTTYADETPVSVQKIGGTTKYMYVPGYTSTGAAIVIDSASKAAVLNGVDLTASSFKGVVISDAKYNVKTVDAPDVTVSVTSDNALKDSSDQPIVNGTYGAVYDVSSTNLVLTANFTAKEAPSGYTWKYTWKDLTGEGFTTDANSGTAADASTKIYTITSSNKGAHKVSFVAQFWKDADSTKPVFEKVYDATELSAVIADTTAAITYSTSYKYGDEDGKQVSSVTVGEGRSKEGITYSYVNSTNASETGNVLPTNAGTYTMKAVIPADYEHGYKETTLENGELTIQQKDLGTIDFGSDTAILTGSTEKDHTVKLTKLGDYETDDDKFTAAASDGFDFVLNANTGDVFDSVSFANNTLTYKLKSTVSAESYSTGATLTGTLSNRNYTVTATVTVMIKSSGTIEKTFSDVEDPITVSYGEYTKDTLLKEIIARSRTNDDELTYYTVKYGTDKSDNYPTGVAEDGIFIYITYDNKKSGSEAVYGTATRTLVITKAEQAAPTADPTLTFTADKANGNYALAIDDSALNGGTVEYSRTAGGFGTSAESAAVKKALTDATYTSGEEITFYVRYAATETLAASEAKEVTTTAPAALAAPSISSEYTSDGGKTVTITSTDKDVTIYYTIDGNDPTTSSTPYTEAFTIAASDISSKDVTVKAIAVKENTLDSAVATATLTKKSEAPYTPASGIDTDKTPSDTTTEPTLTTNEDGDKVIVDADGKVIANELVTTSDGKSYVTGDDGVILTSQIAEVGDIKVYVGKNGVVATDKAVTYNGKKYYATETGEIATNRFVETARGNKVYATKTGALKTSTAFTVNGKKYYAKASGVIATTGFVKTAKGNTVYATKSGALQVNKAFKASNGKKYVADKNGKIVKGKKITIGNKVYTTNKKGVIVKVTTKKK